MKYLLSIIVCMLMAQSSFAQQTTVTSYTRKGQKTTLDLNWGTSNYGTVQWQKSSDNGQTWEDISGATKDKYTATINAECMYRAHVVGDPACQPIDIVRKIVPVSFNVNVKETTATSATLEVTDITLPVDEIVEYGFASCFSGLGRSFDMLPLTKVGESVPEDGNLSFECKGLRPDMGYSIRFYVKTKDGSVVFGPGKLATTQPGIEWLSEDWTITKNLILGKFQLAGDAEISDVAFSYGTSLDNLTASSCTATSNGQYSTAKLSRLQPSTTYVLVAKAVVNGEQQEIMREISTLPDYSSYEVDNTVSPVKHKINWGVKRTLTKISDPNLNSVEYPRICRLANGDLLLTYHGGTQADHWQDSYYRISHDEGKTWSDHVMLFDNAKSFLGSGYWRICNPQATVLDNGYVILSATANGNPETNYNCKVICTISKDNCRTWSDPIVVGRGRTWEPHVLQLPGGELELYVSSEAAWWQNGGNDQEIVYARSTDYGQTWTSFKRCSYLQGGRDGMPVPVLMQGNKGVLFSIESPAAGAKPSFVHRALDEEWESAAWDRNDDFRRWATGLNGGAGGPYCVQLPTGEIVASAHTNQAGSVWQTNRPQVCLHDNTGHNPAGKTLPCTTGNPLAGDEGAYYNSLWVKDANHIWLLTTRVTYDGETRKNSSIEYIEGEIVEK